MRWMDIIPRVVVLVGTRIKLNILKFRENLKLWKQLAILGFLERLILDKYSRG